MKKIRLLIAIIAVSLYSMQSAWAERVAPTFPEAKTLESGQTYYLYNVGSGNFVYCYNTRHARANSTTRTGIVITEAGEGLYTLRFSDNNYYWYMSSTSTSEMQCTSSKYEPYTNFIIATTEGGYTIQRNYSYDETRFVGNNNDYYIYANLTSGNIVWQLFDAEGAEAIVRYKAKKALYDALETAIGYEFAIADYEAIYENEASTNDELNAAATALNTSLGMSQGYKASYWNEYPIMWATSAGSFGKSEYDTWALPNSTTNINGNKISYSSGGFFYTYFNATTGSRTLSATVNVSEMSTFIYSTSSSTTFGNKIQVYIDDVLVRTLTGPQICTYPSENTYARFFEVLQPGTHTIKWVASTSSSDQQYFYIRNVGVVNSPLITVNLLEPGSLGTEALYNTDHIKNVRRLKVIGKMNDDDWAKLKMMSGLLDLDLSEAEFTEVPEGQFRVTSRDTVMQFLHRLILPEGVTKINKEAFYYSFIDTLALPSTLRNIRENAFYACHIQEIDMPDDCTEIYGTETYSTSSYYPVFSYMKWLRKLKCAKNWTVIPRLTFSYCNFIEDVTLPEKLKAIGESSFENNYYMNLSFPESLQRIRSGAFDDWDNIVHLVLPKNVSTLESNAFAYCSKLESAELSVHQYSISNNLFTGCNKLKTLRLNSPTVATVTSTSGNYPVDASRLNEVDLIVPSFLVNAYKLDKYWYNFKSITGFSTTEIQDWVINNPMVMNHDRFEGNPNITINGNYDRKPSLKFNGTSPQDINNLNVNGYAYYASAGSDKGCKNFPGQIYSNSDNITVNGDVSVSLYTEAKRWYFFSLPFDMKVSDITHQTADVQYKIGYYDGAERALYGTNGSWKNIKGKSFTDTEGWDLTTEYTETLDSYSNNRIYGTSITIGENGEVNNSRTSANGEYFILLNTNKDNQIKIRVNEGYKITSLAITAWSNNTSSQADRSIILNGAYIDGSFTSVLTEDVTFPGGSVGRTPTTATLAGLDATKLIRLTFDNSQIVSSSEDNYGYNKQIYTKLVVSYKQIVPEAEEGMPIIPAGTGFIMQTNKDTWNNFHAVDNDMKQNIVSYSEFVKGLEVNPSEKKANTGWNLVGNPYQCFYNSHCLNFTAPITVWDAYNRKYVAYSITDDDYAIRPNEAFFVQCPNEEYNTIGFPLQGRQFTDVIETQNAAPAMNQNQKERKLIDIILTASDQFNDETRVVLNEKATLDYEISCDASKFMSMDNSVPQLFTIDEEGTRYAINERPIQDGHVKAGLYVAKSGTYTFSTGRCDMEKVMLIDNETGDTTDISYGEYTFSTEAGTFTDRFEIVFEAINNLTGIEKVMDDTKTKSEAIYNIAGQRVNAGNMRGIYIVNGKKVIK